MAKRNFTMTADHKQALARGRQQGKVVRDYLDSLNQGSKPGRKLSTRELDKRISDVQKKIDASDDAAARLKLVQQRLEYEQRLVDAQTSSQHDEREKDFVKVVKDYSERQGIGYKAWREVGVPAAVLKRGGVSRAYKG